MGTREERFQKQSSQWHQMQVGEVHEGVKENALVIHEEGTGREFLGQTRPLGRCAVTK